MSTFEAKLTSKGQITLPAGIRDRLGVDVGDKVVFTETSDGAYRLHARRNSMADLKGIIRTGPKISSDDIANWIDEARGKALPPLQRSRSKRDRG